MRIRWRGRHAALLSIAARSGAIAVTLILAGSMLVWGVDLARRAGGFAPAAPPQADLAGQVASLQADLAKMKLERAQLVASSENSAADGAIRDRQTIQIKALQVENGKLVEDLADFASRMPAVPSIHRAEAELSAPSAIHYRLLLAHGAGGASEGQVVQLMVAGEQGGKPVLLPFPAEAAGDAAQPGPQRFEGTLAVPEGVTVRAITARLLDKGRVRIQQAVTLRSANHVRS